MAIIHGFTATGDFVAADPETKAAERGHKGSTYWLLAKNDPNAAAAEMIRETLALRDMIPDLPSHQPDAWNANFSALSTLIRIKLTTEGDGNGDIMALADFVAVNEFSAPEVAEITNSLAEGGSYTGGGGAAPVWSIKLV
jgi:hypothetical protein